MYELPSFIVSRIDFGLKCGLLNGSSRPVEVYNMIGHRQYVWKAVKMLRSLDA